MHWSHQILDHSMIGMSGLIQGPGSHARLHQDISIVHGYLSPTHVANCFSGSFSRQYLSYPYIPAINLRQYKQYAIHVQLNSTRTYYRYKHTIKAPVHV